MYINGVKDCEVNLSEPVIHNSLPFYIGKLVEKFSFNNEIFRTNSCEYF
jgi:hypothetical protein